ncbi:cyclin-P4-1 [Phoenix dactylifera]|uniref:Cyclin n=1 Tax=Phoenix dactylifera TaxID=42345 RepID=A0A8B7BVH0_PHODC|nr:cyclin-P4-1 [Phoenix dactylifera]
MAEMRGEDRRAIPRAVSALSSILQRVADLSDLAVHRPPPLHHRAAAFHGLRRPNISVHGYLERIFRHADCSPACYAVAYVYLDRFTRRHPPVLIDSFNVHRLLITTILAAVKFMDDIHYGNAYFAKVGGISLMEMNCLEMDFLFGVGFELNVTPMIFHSCCYLLWRETYQWELPPAPLRFQYCCSTEEESSSCQ